MAEVVAPAFTNYRHRHAQLNKVVNIIPRICSQVFLRVQRRKKNLVHTVLQTVHVYTRPSFLYLYLAIRLVAMCAAYTVKMPDIARPVRTNLQ